MKKYLALGSSLLALSFASSALATISSPTVQVVDQGNGSTTTFNYPFLIPTQSDGVTPAVSVLMEDNLGNFTQISQGNSNGQFQITGVGNGSGGTVSFVQANGQPLPSGWSLVIERALDYTQPIAVNNFSFYPHTVEVTSDNLAAQIQQLAQGLSTTLQFPPNDTPGFTLPTKANRENMVFGFDASGNPILEPPGGLGVYGSVNPGDCAYFYSAVLLADFGASCGSGGGGGGGGSQILFTQIATTTLGSNLTIALSGYWKVGDLGAGMVMTSVAANLSTNCWGQAFDAHHQQFCLVPEGFSNPGWFGSPGDHGASKITSTDITNHPEWRGSYTAAVTSWDTVGAQEARYLSEATLSTPGNIIWNYPNTPNLTLFTPSAPSGYGITQTLNEGAVYFREIFGPGSCLHWLGAASSSMIYMNSNAYGRISQLCVVADSGTSVPFSGAPLIDLDHVTPVNVAISTQQLVFDDLQVDMRYNIPGISINPIGGGNAQGSTIIFNEPEFVCYPGSFYAIWNNGSNAIQNRIHDGDIEACTKYSIFNTGGGSFNVDLTTTENENTNYFSSPIATQFTEGGADFFSNGNIASDLNHVDWHREEGSVAVICTGLCRIGNGGYNTGLNDAVPWGEAGENFQQGWAITPEDGHVLMYVADGGPTNGNSALGWRNITTASSNRCTITDGGPGSTGWTTNEWQGSSYGIFARFVGGSTLHEGIPEWNSTTQVSVCNETNSSISGTTLTVNSVSQGLSDIGVGASVLVGGVVVANVIALGSGSGGAGTYTLNNSLSYSSQTMEIGHAFSQLATDEFKITGTVGSSAPNFSSVYPGQMVVGQTEGGGSSLGCSMTASSTSITIVGMTPVNNDWVVVPGQSFVGTGAGGTPQIPGAYIVQISSCSGSVCTASLPADMTFSKETCYMGAGLTDGNETLIDFDVDVLRGITYASDFTSPVGRARNIQAYNNVSFRRSDWNRGGNTGAINAGNGTIQYSAVYGQPATQMDTCPGNSGTVAWPQAVGAVIECSAANDFTITAPPQTVGQAKERTIIIQSSSASHVVTFGTGFKSTGTLNTSGVSGQNYVVKFLSDGTNFNEVSRSGPE